MPFLPRYLIRLRHSTRTRMRADHRPESLLPILRTCATYWCPIRFHYAFIQTVAGVQKGVNATKLKAIVRRRHSVLPAVVKRAASGLQRCLTRPKHSERNVAKPSPNLTGLTQSIFVDMFGDPVVNPMNWRVGHDWGTTCRGSRPWYVSRHRPRNDPVTSRRGLDPLGPSRVSVASSGWLHNGVQEATYSDVGPSYK